MKIIKKRLYLYVSVLIKVTYVEVEIYDLFSKKYSIEFNQIHFSFGY